MYRGFPCWVERDHCEAVNALPCLIRLSAKLVFRDLHQDKQPLACFHFSDGMMGLLPRFTSMLPPQLEKRQSCQYEKVQRPSCHNVSRSDTHLYTAAGCRPIGFPLHNASPVMSSDDVQHALTAYAQYLSAILKPLIIALACETVFYGA